MQTNIAFPFKFAPPFNYDLACQFVYQHNLKDDMLEALDLQIKFGDSGGYSWWKRTAVDDLRSDFRKANITKHEAILMYLSRLFELKPMWWSVSSMSQLEQMNNLVDEMAMIMRSKMFQIVESGLVSNQIPIQMQQSEMYQSFPFSQSHEKSNNRYSHYNKPYEPKLEKIIEKQPKIPEVINKKLEPSTSEFFTMEEMNMVVETDLNGKESDLLVRVHCPNHNFQEKTFTFSLKESKNRTKLWKSSIVLEEEGKYEISLEQFGKTILKENRLLCHRKISLQNSINKSTWNRKCKVGEDCTVFIPCVNSNSSIIKQFNIEDVKAIVNCGNKQIKCAVSHVENTLQVQFQSFSVGNALLQISFEDQNVEIPFIVEYKEVCWSKTSLFAFENVQIQDSKWVIREKCPIKLIFKIYDKNDKSIEFFDMSQFKARVHTQMGNTSDCLMEFLPEQSSIQISFTAPTNLGNAFLSILLSNTLSTLQKYPIEIIKARTLQIGILDQKSGIGSSLKDKLKEQAMKQNLQLNIQNCNEIQKPDIVLRFIYHNGPPTWSDFRKTLADDHNNYVGASVIMVLATLNKQYWKMDSPDDQFPSGVNLTHLNSSRHKRGVVWIYYNFNGSTAAKENDPEIEHLVQLMSLKI